jgi:hypothetical protein
MPFVALTVRPSSVELKAGESQAFEALVDGDTRAENVQWTITESFGKVDEKLGIYCAPERMFRSRRITIVATRKDADGEARGSAVIELDPSRSWITLVGAWWVALFFLLLVPLFLYWRVVCPSCTPPGLFISPPVVTLGKGQAQQFLTNAAVTWTNTVNLAGLYVAPSTIDTEQLVTVSATSRSDPQQSAMGIVRLSPAAGLAVIPGRVTVPFGGKVKLTASVSGAAQVTPTWLQPADGTIAPDGTYTAPARGEPQAIVVLAQAQVPGSPSTLLAGSLVSVVHTAPGPCDSPGSPFWRLLLLVAWVGTLGGLTHAMGSFGTYVGNRELKVSWLWWYGLKPVLSASVAVLVFLVFRAGLGAPDLGLAAGDCLRIAGFAGLVGLFAEPATVKLKDVFEAIFTPRRDPREDKSGQSTAAPSPPEIASVTPRTMKASKKTVLEIRGKNFAEGCAVHLGGRSHPTRWISASELRVELAAGALKPGPNTLLVANKPPDGDASKPETITVEA